MLTHCPSCAAVPLPPAASGRGKDTAALHRRDIAAELAASRQQSGVAPAAAVPPRQPPFCPLPDADATASDLRVPYAGGWLKGVDFGCSSEAPAGVPLTKMTGTPAFMVRLMPHQLRVFVTVVMVLCCSC
jgi:hypothetical protein